MLVSKQFSSCGFVDTVFCHKGIHLGPVNFKPGAAERLTAFRSFSPGFDMTAIPGKDRLDDTAEILAIGFVFNFVVQFTVLAVH